MNHLFRRTPARLWAELPTGGIFISGLIHGGFPAEWNFFHLPIH
jgi:hypothetical protein